MVAFTVPVASQLVRAVVLGPHRRNVTLPVGAGGLTPVTWILAESDTVAVPLTPLRTVLPLGVVTREAPHSPKPPRMKSLRTAVVEVDERDSEPMLEKHSELSPSVERLM